MARSGSSNLANCFKACSSETVSQEVHGGSTIPYNKLEEIPSSMFKIMIHDYSDKQLDNIIENNNVLLLYRQNKFERAVSMCLGAKTQVWQKCQIQNNYSDKVTIDKSSFKKLLAFQNYQEKRIIQTSERHNIPVFTYESLYYTNTEYEIRSINSYLGSDLRISEAIEYLKIDNGKLNVGYDILSNYNEVLGWYNEQ